MSNKDPPDSLIASKIEYKDFLDFRQYTQKIGNNYSFYAIPNNTFYERKINEKKEKRSFYQKYFDLYNQNLSQPFYLEAELAKHVIFWHSTPYDYKPPILTQDNYFNEEMNLSNVLTGLFIFHTLDDPFFYYPNGGSLPPPLPPANRKLCCRTID